MDEQNKFSGKKMDRRKFLKKSGIAAGVVIGVGLLGSYPLWKGEKSASTVPEAPAEADGQTASDSSAAGSGGESPFIAYPFKLGIASGDPLPDGVVLWTRLAPAPTSTNGGMPDQPYTVLWEVAEDEQFAQVVKSGTEKATPQYAHSVHAEVTGLKPDRWYYYRFKAGSEVSPTGRTKTAPAPGADVKKMNFAFASCQNFPAGYFSAYDHLVKEDIEAVFFLGDYIYEGARGTIKGRQHFPNKAVHTLSDYRLRYGQYKVDPGLKEAHAAFPWIVAPDDHEVRNDWTNDGPPYDDTKDFLERRAAAYQAYYEHMPLRKAALPKGPDMQLYRRFTYGNLAEFSVLDTRQFRSHYACGEGNIRAACDERLDPTRSIMGADQEKWLFDGLAKSKARWNVIPQQVMMAQRDREPGSGVAYQIDKWDGYVASRDRLFKHVKDSKIKNFVVLSGDQHNNWVNLLKEDFNDEKSATLGVEFLGTSITSGGNGTDMNEDGRTSLAENPHMVFFNDQRGYVVCQVTPDQWRTDFRVLSYVNKPGSPVKTRASFVMANGVPGVKQL
jgi:alkaline phosphatase D